MRYFRLFTILIICFLFFACVSTDDGVDLFFMGEDAVQYFFPSREWNSSIEGLYLEADWLYRTYSLDREEEARTILNFSLYSMTNLYRTVPDGIQLSAGQVEIFVPSKQISLVYLDRGKTRYSSWLFSSDVEKLMAAASESMVVILAMDKDIIFESSPEFIPQIEYFQEVLLGIPSDERN